MTKSKFALALAAVAITGFGASTVTATTEPPATEAEGTEAMGTEAMGTEAMGTDAMGTEAMGTDAMGTEAMGTEAAEEGGSGYLTLEDACAEYDGLQAPEDFRVNLVTDLGKVDDGTFNQFAFEGMNAAAECFGIANTSFIETVSEADYGANIATSLEESPNVLITVGFLLATDTEAAAIENPDTTFIGIDQFLEEYPANMSGVLFAEEESGYIAGVFAASLTETGIIGVVAGREDVAPVVKFVNGYTAGAQSVNPDIQVLSIYNESFTDPAKGASDAAQFIGEGADVIFGAGGNTGSGGIAAAAEAGVWAIGVDQDEYFTTFAGGSAPGADHLATSAVKRVDLATFRLIADAIEGDFASGIFAGNTANDMVTYAPAHDADVPQEATDAAEAARVGLADGSITTGVCGIDGLFVGEGSACDDSGAAGTEAAGTEAAGTEAAGTEAAETTAAG